MKLSKEKIEEIINFRKAIEDAGLIGTKFDKDTKTAPNKGGNK